MTGFNLDSNGDDMPHRPASYRGTFTPITMEKDVWTCKETLDMGDDFGSYDKPTPLERTDNPMMAETPKLNFPDDPSRQEQSDKFFKVKRGSLFLHIQAFLHFSPTQLNWKSQSIFEGFLNFGLSFYLEFSFTRLNCSYRRYCFLIVF